MYGHFTTFIYTGQKKVQVELAGGIQDGHGCFQMASFFSIGSPLLSWGEIKQEFGRSGALSHRLLRLSKHA
jgi:hypothetical protein